MNYIKIILYDILKYTQYLLSFIFFINILSINIFYINCSKNLHPELIKLLYKSINSNGCLLIKFVQWIVSHNKFIELSERSTEYKLFKNFLENCEVHDIKYTIDLYKKEFNQDFLNDYSIDNSFTIKSGSIAQVYKCYEKNDINKENPLCIKVVHPDMKYQIFYIKFFIKSIKFLTDNLFTNYFIPFQFETFFFNLLKQLDMNNEYSNLEYFYKTYEDNPFILVPKPINKTKNFLIMSFIEGEIFENMELPFNEKQEIAILLNMFLKDNYFFCDYYHSDLHQSNWKVKKIDGKHRLIIYDFGYVQNNFETKEIFKKIFFYLDTNNVNEISKILYENIINLNSEKISINDFSIDFCKNVKFKSPWQNYNIEVTYNYLYKNKYILKNSILEILISSMLISFWGRKYFFGENHNLDEFYENNYQLIRAINDEIYTINIVFISILKKYKIFKRIENHLYENFIKYYHIKNKNMNFDNIDNNNNKLSLDI